MLGIFIDESHKDYPIQTIGAISCDLGALQDFEVQFLKFKLENLIFHEIKYNQFSKDDYFCFEKISELFFESKNLVFHCNSFKEHKYKAGYRLIESIFWKLINTKRIKKKSIDAYIFFDEEGKNEKKIEIPKIQKYLEIKYKEKLPFKI